MYVENWFLPLDMYRKPFPTEFRSMIPGISRIFKQTCLQVLIFSPSLSMFPLHWLSTTSVIACHRDWINSYQLAKTNNSATRIQQPTTHFKQRPTSARHRFPFRTWAFIGAHSLVSTESRGALLPVLYTSSSTRCNAAKPSSCIMLIYFMYKSQNQIVRHTAAATSIGT